VAGRKTKPDEERKVRKSISLTPAEWRRISEVADEGFDGNVSRALLTAFEEFVLRRLFGRTAA
jgi:hypothetical protein